MIKLKKKRTYKLKKKNVMDGRPRMCDECMHAKRLAEILGEVRVCGKWEYLPVKHCHLECFFESKDNKEKYAIVYSRDEAKIYLVNGNAIESIEEFDAMHERINVALGYITNEEFANQRNTIWNKYRDTEFTLYEVIFEDDE